MIILGLVFFLVGYFCAIGILETIGIVLLAIGAVLFMVGAVGHPIGGRRYWF